MMERIHASLRPLSSLLLAMLVLQGCNALNPLCGSARPAPSISSLSPATITFAQVQQGFLLTVNGSHIVSSSVVVINGDDSQHPGPEHIPVTGDAYDRTHHRPRNSERHHQHSKRKLRQSRLH